jgi:hypothetical protein
MSPETLKPFVHKIGISPYAALVQIPSLPGGGSNESIQFESARDRAFGNNLFFGRRYWP